MNDIDRARDYDRGTYRADDPDLEPYEYEDEDNGPRVPLFVVLAVVVILSIVGVWYVAYQQGVKDGLARNQNTRLITADGNAERVRPGASGGQEAPQDRDVFRRLNGQSEDSAERVVPREEPIVDLPRAPSASGGTASSAPASGSQAQPNLRGAPQQTQQRSTPPAAQPSRTAQQQTPQRTTPQPRAPQPVETTAAPDSQSDRILVPPPSARLRNPPGGAAATPAASNDDVIGPPAPSGPRPAASGNFVVQLASLPSQAAADQTWSRVANRYSSLLGPYTKDVQAVDLGARGIFYRLRIGYFATRDAATNLCATLKSQGQDCLVASR